MAVEPLEDYVLVPYDPSHGYPGRWNRYFRCTVCGDVIPTSPPTLMGCTCGNLLVQIGHLQVKNKDHQPQLLKKKFFSLFKNV